MPPVLYREAGLDDVPGIARVNSDTLRECGLAPPEIYAPERLLARWDAYIRRVQHPQHALEPRALFGAFHDDRLIGYIAGHFSGRHGAQGELESIYILKDFQRRGVGSALLAKLADWFVTNHRRTVCVGIEPANPYKQFYEKRGARYINPHWLVWDDIGALALSQSTD